jgi:hypothetical protein
MPGVLANIASKFLTVAQKEVATIEELHGEVRATLDRMEAKDPGLKNLLRHAHAYAVFPSVGKATAVIGGAFGKGEVIRGGRVVGYAALGQLTLGVQLGGQTFSEVIAFQDAAAFDRFKQGRYAFAANASAVMVKAGAARRVRRRHDAGVGDRGAEVLVPPRRAGACQDRAQGKSDIVPVPRRASNTREASACEACDTLRKTMNFPRSLGFSYR